MSAYFEAGAGVSGARRLRDLAVQAGTSCGRIAASRQGSLVVALVAITAIWTLAAIQWRLTDTVVPWDSKNQFYAFFRFLATALSEGNSPFWNPYHYGGHPSIADPQSLIFSAPFLLWAWFDPTPTMLAFDALVYGHLLVGGLALAGYGHRHGWPAAASVLAASVFMLGGVVSGRLNHVGIIIAFGLFPLAFLALEVALEKRSWLASLGFGLVAGMIVVNRTETPLLLSVILVVLALTHLAVQPRPLRYFWSRLPLLILMGVVALALLAVPMLLTVQFANFSNRPHISLDVALLSSLYPVNIANFFAPNILGSLEPAALGDWGPSHGTRPGIDGTDRAFNYMFAGSLTALLVAWHGLAGGRLMAPGRRVFTALAAFALFYSVGRYSPLFPLMFEYVPGIALFRRPVTGLFIFVLALSYLAGYLVSDYVRNGLPKVPRWALGLVAVLLVGLFAWAIDFSTISAKGWRAAGELAKVVPIYGALIVLIVLAKAPRARLAVASLAVAFTGGELVLRNAASSLNAEPRAYYALLEKPTGEAARVLDTIQQAVNHTSTGAARPRVEIVGLGGPWQNAAMVYGLQATNGYNPLRIGPYDRLVAPGESPYTALHRRFPTGSFPGYNCDLSKLLGLEYVVLDRPIESMPHLHRRTVAETIMAGPTVWIYRLPDPAPRVALMNQVRVADADELVDQGRFPNSSGVGSPREVMVDDDDDLTQSYVQTAVNAQPGKAEIIDWRPSRVEIAIETRTTAVLTYHAIWYPGWEVEVDGVRKPILRTDVLFRGVEVPAGARRVVFTYRPLSLENLKAAFDSMLGRDNE
jgi:hypothetical protein